MMAQQLLPPSAQKKRKKAHSQTGRYANHTGNVQQVPINLLFWHNCNMLFVLLELLCFYSILGQSFTGKRSYSLLDSFLFLGGPFSTLPPLFPFGPSPESCKFGNPLCVSSSPIPEKTEIHLFSSAIANCAVENVRWRKTRISLVKRSLSSSVIKCFLVTDALLSVMFALPPL